MFYVYVLRYPDGTPFYVGKGRGERAYRHSTESPYVKQELDKLSGNGEIPTVNILLRTENEDEAFEKEIHFIEMFGRKDKGIGSLLNRSDGGKEAANKIISEETRNKLSKIGFEIRSSKEYRNQQAEGTRRQWQDEKRKTAYKQFQKDRWRTDKEYRQKVSEAARFQAFAQWNDPVKRARLLEARKNARRLK